MDAPAAYARAHDLLDRVGLRDRADAYPGREDAVAFTVTKAKQIIDLQGDRMFEQG